MLSEWRKNKSHRITKIIKTVILRWFFFFFFGQSSSQNLEAFLLIPCKTSIWQEIMGWKTQESQLMSFKGQWVFED